MSAGEEPLPVSILLVDDRPSNLLTLEATLARPDYRLVSATSGEEALLLVLREEFAVILLDVAMPGMDGFEVASLVKQRGRSQGTPIIFVTASVNDVESITRGYEAGAVDYLQKPLDPHLVRAKVSVFVQLYRQRLRLQRQEELLREGERRAHELELTRLNLAAEQRLSAILRSIGDGVVATDREGRVEFMNATAERLTGWTSREAAGRRYQEVIPLVDEATGATIPCPVEEARSLLGPVPLAVPSAVRRRDGTRVPVEDSAAPIRDERGGLVGVVFVFRDVTEERRAAEREGILALASGSLLGSLDHQEATKRVLGILVPAIADGCAIDMPGEEGMAGLSEVAAAYSASRQALEEARSAPGPEPFHQAELLPLPGAPGGEGRAREAALIRAPLFARGRTLGAMTLVRATPDRGYGPEDLKLAEELARRAALALDSARLYAASRAAVRVRDEFLSVAAHELRTPLTALRLDLQAVGRAAQVQDPRERGRLDKAVGVSLRQADRLTRLADNLLDVSRITAGRLEMHRQRVDLADMVREATAQFREAAERAGSAIALEVRGSATGEWDPVWLAQVVKNLLSNALKYGAGKPVEVAVAAEPEVARLEVRDHGIGLSAADRERVFERFERAVSGRHYGGLGLGLWITRKIVDALGGEIDVESVPGHGATFTVRLPRRPDPAAEIRHE